MQIDDKNRLTEHLIVALPMLLSKVKYQGPVLSKSNIQLYMQITTKLH